MCLLVIISLFLQTHADILTKKPSRNLETPSFDSKYNNFNPYPYPEHSTPVNNYIPPANDPGYIYEKPSTNRPLADEIPSNPGYHYNHPTGNTFNLPSITTTTQFTLPEIIINKSLRPVYGPPETTKRPESHDEYPQYLPPQADIPLSPPAQYLPPDNQFFPPQSDVPSGTYIPPQSDIPSNGYLPPQNDLITIDIPDNSYLPPAFDEYPEVSPETPSNSYLPAQSDPPRDDRKYVPPSFGKSNKSGQMQIHIYNMSCISSPSRTFFRTIIRTSRPLENDPVIENALTDRKCIGSGQGSSYFDINLAGFEQVKRCGVKECYSTGTATKNRVNLCMNVRFPTVAGLKLPEDVLLTLQCQTQEKIVSQIKFLNMNALELQGRSVQTAVAKGGSQNNLDSNIALLRRTLNSNEFNSQIRNGNAVYLGEDILLKAHVKNTDGWKFSRLSEVVMHKVGTGDQQNSKQSAELLDSRGCRNSKMRYVCPKQQAQEIGNPLISSLPIRAFMFQGMKSGDAMLLSVRLTACLEYSDCYPDPWPCDDSKTSQKIRGRRQVSNRTTNWEENLSFRIVAPPDFQGLAEKEEGALPKSRFQEWFDSKHVRWIPFFIATLIIFVIFILLVTIFRSLRNKNEYYY